MANKREFKKSLDALSSAIIDEMAASLYNVKESDAKKINDAIIKIAKAVVKAKKDTNVLFGKGVKEFASLAEYNKAKEAFTKQKYDEAIAHYNEALSEALKLYNEGMPDTKAPE